jgi:hypothetical protein
LAAKDLEANYFWRLHREPVLFCSTLLECDRRHPAWYLDASATGTLAGFAKRVLPPCEPPRVAPSLNQFGKDMQVLRRLKAEWLPGGRRGARPRQPF